MHAGKSLSGPANPAWKHGRRSRVFKHLPKKLDGRFQAALHDEELCSLREQLALLDSLMGEVSDKLAETEAPPWDAVVTALGEYRAERDKVKKDAKLAALEEVIASGAKAAVDYGKLVNRLREMFQEKAKLSAVESKRLSDLGAMVTVEENRMFVAAFIDALVRNVTDEEVRNKVLKETARLLPPPSVKTVEEVS